jgi:Tol biopolymer transport system component
MTDVMAAVVREDPDLTRVPLPVQPLLRRCLEKDPKRRLRDIGDAMLLVETSAEAPAAEGRPGGRRLVWGLAAAAAALLAGLVSVLAIHLGEGPAPRRTLRFEMTLPEGLNFSQGSSFALSPDGRHLAYPAVGADGVARVWVHSFDAVAARPLSGTELLAANPGPVTWSPDSRSVVFVQDRKLKRIDISGGGPPQVILDLPTIPSGASWHRNGTILLGTAAGITAVDGDTGATTQVTRLDESRNETTHLFPTFLPDGETFLYSRGGALGSRGIYIASLSRTPEEQPSEPLVMSDVQAAFVPGPGGVREGWLVYVRDAALLAQRFNPSDAEPRLVGDPHTVTDQVFFTAGPNGGFAFFSASEEGTLVYRTGTLATNFARQLAWYSREGKPLGTVSDPARHLQLKVSPDGTRMVSSRTDLETGNNADLWITDLESGASTRFTFGGAAHVQPTWSPDGKQIAWVAVRQGLPTAEGGGSSTAGIYRKPADGSGTEELLYTFDGAVGAVSVSDWSSDGRFLVFARGGDIFALPLQPGDDGSREPIAVVHGPGREFGPDLSPDSKWIAYISNDTGRQELYVQPFVPGVSGGTPVSGKWMVSSRGTLGLARWRGDGRELLFVSADGTLMAIDVTATPVFKAGAPRELSQLPRSFLAQTTNPGTLADTTREGDRILLAMPSESSTRPELHVVVNWQPQ